MTGIHVAYHDIVTYVFGSGRGVRLTELAERVLAVTRSTSQVRYLPSREVEVARFVADVTRMHRALGIEPPPDSLDGLEPYWLQWILYDCNDTTR